jgi:hypothetical protein
MEAVAVRTAMIGERARRGDEQHRLIRWRMIFSENRCPLFGIMRRRRSETCEHGGEKTEGGGRVAMLLRRDLVQRADREPAVRQVRVERVEPEGTRARRAAHALHPGQQATQLIHDRGAVSTDDGDGRQGHGIRDPTKFPAGNIIEQKENNARAANAHAPRPQGRLEKIQ